MKAETMTEDSNTQHLLGKIEVKMDNIKESNDELKGQVNVAMKEFNSKLDGFGAEVNTLKIDIAEIKAKQRPEPARVSGWQIFGFVVAAVGTVVAVLATLFIIIPKFAGL